MKMMRTTCRGQTSVVLSSTQLQEAERELDVVEHKSEMETQLEGRPWIPWDLVSRSTEKFSCVSS